MKHGKFFPILAILVLSSCGPRIPDVVVPLPPPTITTMPFPTPGPIQVETPGAGFYASGQQAGSINIPASGDAGNFFLYADSTVTLTWNDPPLDAARYDFTILDASGIPFVIGTDIDLTDGASIQWLVPANLSGYELGGIAYSAEGQAVYYAYGGTVYSGEAPPQDICTLANNTIGAFPVHLAPNPSAQVFAELAPGQYVQVYEHIANDWYRVDTSKLEIYSNTTLLCGESPSSPCRGYSDSDTGWVHAEGGLKWFGPCEQYLTVNEAGESQDPIPASEYIPVGNTPLSPIIVLPTEMPTSLGNGQANEEPGIRIYGHISKSDGSGLANVRVFLSLAAYSGNLVAITDENGDFRTEFKFIPGDENVTVWVELENYTFTPSIQYWRHYYGYEERTLNFVAVDSSSP